MEYDDAYGARDSNPSLLSSIIAKLANLDEILENLNKIMINTKEDTERLDQAKKEMNNNLIATVNNIQTELTNKLNNILEKLKQHQLNQRADGLKLQQEISHLKKEKLHLYQHITEIQKKIADVENIIGYDMR